MEELFPHPFYPAMATLLPPAAHPRPLHPIPTTTTIATPTTINHICQQGNLRQAFQALPHLLPTTSPAPLQRSLASLLDLCAARAALPEGRQVHALALTSPLPLDADFLRTKLTFFYALCGSLPDARRLFDQIARPSVFAWNAIIGAYSDHSGRDAHRALELFRDMRASGAAPDACSVALVAKACGVAKEAGVGREVHGLAVKSGLCHVVFVANALIAMYGKCGGFDEATRLFRGLVELGGDGVHDSVSWNSVILAHLQSGLYLETLRLFREMQEGGFGMSSYTAVGVLQACGELSLSKVGMEIHARLLKSNWCGMFEGNALVVLYSKCGKLDYAVRLFYEMDGKDHVSWNSMMSGYLQNGFYEEVLCLFAEMQGAGLLPDQVSVMSAISVCGRLMSLQRGMECHAFAVKHGFDCDVQVGNTLVDMYCKCMNVDYAQRVFSGMPCRDFITWTTILAGLAQNHCYHEALELFRKVEMEGMKADPMMIGSILLVSSGLKCVAHVREIHCYGLRHGLLDTVLVNSLIDVYGECGNVEAACKLFELMDSKSVVSWTSMISCFVSNGQEDAALLLFHNMVKAGVQPDSVSVISALSASSGLSALSKGKELHGFMVRHCFVIDGSLSSALLDMYSRCGALSISSKVFDWIGCKDLVLWTSMINAYGMHGQGHKALDLYRRMEEIGLVPDHITFLAILYACSHSGLTEEGKNYLEIMKHRYQLEPWPEHYACIVDLLCRSNCLNEAYEFIINMPTAPTSVVWCALLGACQVHCNYELGEIAAQKLIELDPENPGNYVLVSNFFAAKGKWKYVDAIRLKMKEKQLTKVPACSWIEVENKVHSFIVRDKSHPQTAEIYGKLSDIYDVLDRDGAYVPNTKFVLHNLSEEEKKTMLYGHSERLAIAFGLLNTSKGTTIRITKNLRVCGDCHQFTKFVSKLYDREIVVRDSNRFHHFSGGICSCGDFW